VRIDVLFIDRVGIAQEILGALARRDFNVTAVEVEPPHIYVEAPDLDAPNLVLLERELALVGGVQSVQPLGMLPGAQRRLYLDALLVSQPDPVFAIDAAGTIVLANTAAATASKRSVSSLCGTPIHDLIGLSDLARSLAERSYQLPAMEVLLCGEPFMLETLPLFEPGGQQMAGMVCTLHAPTRMGGRLSGLQNLNSGGFEAIFGESAVMLELKQRARRMALVDAPLLITGETGTGKELLAHACHATSHRSSGPFFALNCAAIPESLAESELFGYAAGAFTGALRGGKPGLLELSDGGTVFLDEIGEMSPYLQAKLLRFLNDGRFRRVGAERDMQVNVRIISATHRPLDEMVARGEFRQDLLFRLNVLNLRVPPLRERSGDIIALATELLARACTQAGHPPMRLTPLACQALLANPWAGNVRQLQNVLFRAVTMTDRTFIDVRDLELVGALQQAPLGLQGPPQIPPHDTADTDSVETLEAAVMRFEKALLEKLWHSYPSTRLLARRLGTSHTAIAKRLTRYGIAKPGSAKARTKG